MRLSVTWTLTSDDYVSLANFLADHCAHLSLDDSGDRAALVTQVLRYWLRERLGEACRGGHEQD